jgi:hypothetical protein
MGIQTYLGENDSLVWHPWPLLYAGILKSHAARMASQIS